jgi:GT2 family glycosyltransferase
MKPIPDVSIVVSCWNSAHILEEALESIVATAGTFNVDVTVLDDASTDGGYSNIYAKYKDDPRFSFVRNEVNVGVAALNIMLERSQAKYIMTLDTDARLQPGALKALYEFMETHPEAGAATANLRNPDGSPQYYYRRTLTPLLYFFTTPVGRFFDKYFFALHFYKQYHYSDLDVTKISELEQPVIAGLMLRRAAFDSYILDPDFLLFGIDIDLCKRLYDKGYKIYLVPDARVIHLKTASARKRGKLWLDRELNRSFALYFKKHHPYASPFLKIAMFLDIISRMFLRSVVGREPMR